MESIQISKGTASVKNGYESITGQINVEYDEILNDSAFSRIEKVPDVFLEYTFSIHEKFKVYGNCEMCEERIENAVESLNGVTYADWDKLSGKIKVKYNPSKVKLLEIHEAIAEEGHDTEKVKADDETYNNLHHCCKYKRSEKNE